MTTAKLILNGQIDPGCCRASPNFQFYSEMNRNVHKYSEVQTSRDRWLHLLVIDENVHMFGNHKQ